MLNRIIDAALRHRTVVLATAALALAFGLWTAVRMPIDVLPDLNRPVVTVLTEAPGMVPEDVEVLVTWPLEQVLNGASGVHRVRSASGAGLSVVWVDFEWGTDVYRDRQVVAERLQLAREALPEGVLPAMAPVSSIMGQVQMVGFQSEGGATDPAALRLLVDKDVVPRLKTLAGIAQVAAIGGRPAELQVVVDAGRLRAFDVTLPEVAAAVREANVNVAGGSLPMGARAPLVTVPGLLETEAELRHAVVRSDPVRPVRIEDVAEVAFGPAARRLGEAGIDGGPGVILVITKQPGADTVALTGRVNEELRRIRPALPEDVRVLEDLFQQAAFIHRAVDNVLDAVRDGSILVVVVLFLFLLNVRTTLITLAAIPLSVALAALVFRAFGLGIDTMTLGGLAVAVGTLVDDAIVDVENVFRRLHENAAAARPRPALEVVFRASGEIRRPVMYGTLLVTVVYLPLFFLGGIEGRLFAPIGLAYVVSVFASLVVALTVTPVLCYLLLGMRTAREREYGGWVVRAIRTASGRGVLFAVRRPMHLLAAVLALGVAAAILFAGRGSSFLPEFDEGSFQINLALDPDASLETSDAYGRRLEEVLGGIEGVEHVARRTGRAEGDEHAIPASVTEAVVTVDPATPRRREEILREIRDRVAAELPGAVASTEQPLKHLLDHLLSGVTASVAIKIAGPDLAVLRRASAEVEAAVRGIPGVRDLVAEPQVLVDQVEVVPDREALGARGLRVADVAETVALAMGGHEVSRLRRGRIAWPIVVRLREEDRRDLPRLRGLYVRRPDEGVVVLGDVADVRLAKTPHTINRENAERRIVVQHNVEGRALSEVVADVEEAIRPVRARLPPGHDVRPGGLFEAQADASRTIAVLSVLALGAMLLILHLHFGSTRLALLVLLSRPIAFIGAVAWIVAADQEVSVATLVGLIALLGVSTRNAILLVDHYLALMRDEGIPFGVPLIVRAGQERAVPILMTALTSGIGLLPLALSPGEPGREILYPVATVMLGGLVSSTLLDFLVTPSLFWLFGRREAARLALPAEAS